MVAIPERVVRVEVGPAGAPGLAWEAPLYMTFSVERDSGKRPNRGRVELYNLSEISLSFLEQGIDRGLVLRILAGELVPALLFQGEVSDRGVQTEIRGPSRVTTIEAGDGEFAFRESRFSRSYPPSTPSTLILADIATQLGIGIGYLDPTIEPKIYPSGFAFAGRGRDILDEIADDLGASWTIQDGNLELVSRGNPTAGRAVVISSETGMQGSPTRTDRGINVTTKLEPEIRPNRIVSVVSIQTAGFYRATKVTHAGDSKGLQWRTELEGVPL